jgi:CRISPR-associated protein Cas2
MKDPEHLYIVTYDIRDDGRWTRTYRTLKGYGEWLQLSVFQCRLTKIKAIRLEAALGDLINREDDHVLIMDLGPADSVQPRVTSLGRPFEAISREAMVV